MQRADAMLSGDCTCWGGSPHVGSSRQVLPGAVPTLQTPVGQWDESPGPGWDMVQSVRGTWALLQSVSVDVGVSLRRKLGPLLSTLIHP